MIMFCIKYLKIYKSRFLIFLLLSLLCGSLFIILPVISGQIVDLITLGNNINLLILCIFTFAILQFLYIIINYLNNRNYIYLQTNSAFKLISDLVFHIQNLPISISDSIDKEYLNQKINNDSNSIIAFTINIFNDFIINVLSLIISIILLSIINNILCFIFICVGLLYLIFYLLLKKNIYNKSLMLKEEQAKFFSIMLEQISLLKFINIHGLFNTFKKRFTNSYESYFKKVIKVQSFFYLYSSIDNVFSIVANIITFILGGILVITKQITIGEFTIVLSYFNIIIGNFKYFSSVGKNYQDNKASYNRINDLLKLKNISNGSIVLNDILSINCRSLTFKRNGLCLINNMNYSFVKGYSYCICGANGKGKTTLIELIIGLHQNEYDGIIEYNNINIENINMQIVRQKSISVMEQDIHILTGSLAENINLNENYNINNVSFLRDNDLFSFIQNRENIFNAGISGGEKSKIGLLRSFSKNAKLYILDEPTASLDNKGIKLVSQIIKDFKRNSILIVISHDPIIINSCDYIINL